MLIHSSKIFFRNVMRDGYLEIENGKFINFYDTSEGHRKADIEYGDLIVMPGIFDTHNHGGFGVRLDNATQEEIKLYLKGLASVGVTQVFATTCELDAMRNVCTAMKNNYEGARIMGIHSEGPWGARVGEKGINTGYPSVDLNLAKEMLDTCDGNLKLVDISPEIPLAKEVIQYFVKNGVNVGMYHTNANYEQANKGVDWGVSVATHLSNVMTGLHHRDVGTLGCGLLRDEVDCELICDGLHVSLPMIKIILKVKDLNHIMMVSDNVQYCGAPRGRYKGFNAAPNSDRALINVTEEGFVLSDTGRLSGSSKPVIYGINNLVNKLNMPLETVIPLFSFNPNRKYGYDNKLGLIDYGYTADFIVVDQSFNVQATFVGGKKVFDKDIDEIVFNQSYLDKYYLGND